MTESFETFLNKCENDPEELVNIAVALHHDLTLALRENVALRQQIIKLKKEEEILHVESANSTDV